MSVGSGLREALDDYLSLRRAVGFKLASSGRLLSQFLDYLQDQGIATITTDAAWPGRPCRGEPRRTGWRSASAWSAASRPTCTASTRPWRSRGGLVRRGPDRATPYLYSDAEIAALMDAASGLLPGLRAATYQTLIGLLAVSGIRIGEAIALDQDDFDGNDGVLVVRDSEFGKDRLVPCTPLLPRL